MPDVLPVVLYGCETWSLTLREKRRLRLFENRVLIRIFVPRRDEVTGEWRKVQMRILVKIPLTKHYSRNKIKKNGDRRSMWHVRGR